MFFLRKPDQARIDLFLQQWSTQPLNYSEVSATNGELPKGYAINHARLSLGSGEDVFQRAKQALRQWQPFELSWLQICWASAPLEAGKMVAVLARTIGLWSLTPCRIVLTIDEEHRFGFSYGAVTGHPLQGEERFLIEREPTTDAVMFEILAFSRPSRWMMKMGSFYIRGMQKRFAREAPLAMLRAVKEEQAEP